ncbi:MAG TPA: Mth938-like domain-containing protein [Kofleriaceae bacterium]|nr:Mth938-like domain-containing protein [Kofleriaceae bacterium]
MGARLATGQALVSYDLEAELLRAAARCAQPFALDAAQALCPRLAHPLLAPLVARLAERLVADGMLVRRDAQLQLTEPARALLAQAPRILCDPPPAEPAMTKPENPRIASFRWGEIVDAAGRTFKDARLYPGGVEEWDWRRTGTRHDPGIQIADLEDLLATAPDVVILTRGVELVLQVPQATIDFACARAATVLVLPSGEAVAEYNRRIPAERVVALVHSTC